MTWWDEEYRRRMKAMGYEPTMDGMDDGDVKDALAAMDRRNAAKQQRTTAGTTGTTMTTGMTMRRRRSRRRICSSRRGAEAARRTGNGS